MTPRILRLLAAIVAVSSPSARAWAEDAAEVAAAAPQAAIEPQQAAIEPQLPARIAPGEEIEWRVDYLGVKTGRARLSVGRPEGDIWPVIAQAKTEGVARILEIREHFVSYWNAAERRSRGNDLEALEIGDHLRQRQHFDREQGKATVTWTRKGREKRKVVDVPANVHDLASAFLWLRLQPLEAGHRYEIPVFTGSDTFMLRAEVGPLERVETDVGPIDAVRVDVQLGFGKKFKTSRPSHVWYSDDLRRVPVKMSADFAVGSVVATMTSYTPGQHQVAAR
jgi:hypothetical protein